MAKLESNLPEIERVDDLTESSDSDVEKNSNDDIDVNIAIVGKAGSGRLGFVKAVLGPETSRAEEGSETTSQGKEPIYYSYPGNPKINFSILPSIDQKTFPAFKPFLDHVEIEKFDAFLIFTGEKFNKRHLIFAKVIKSSNKPIFFIRTKIDDDNHTEKRKEVSIEETMLKDLRASLAKDLNEFHSDENEIYLISNDLPEKWDFLKLTEAIDDALASSQKKCFSKIPQIQKLITIEIFQNYLQGEKLEKPQIILPNFNEMKEVFMERGIAGIQRMMNEKLVQWKEVKINLAILGNSGVGKSSFINAIRGVEDDDKTAAETGITETTTEATAYKFPTNPNILLWDLPGIGTPNYPNLRSFSEEFGIKQYDTFLILSATRFTQNDLLLAKVVKELGKPFFFVRTKIGNDRRSERKKKKFDEEKMLKKIRDDCVRSLEDVEEEQIFLIDNHKRKKWDFNRLTKAIMDQMSGKKKESLTLSMHTNSKEILKDKIELLKGKVCISAIATVGKKRGFWPFPQFVKETRVKEIVASYCSELEFPNHDSEEFKMLSEELQKKVTKFSIGPSQDFLQWLKSFDPDNMYNVTKCKKYIVTWKALAFIERSLSLILDEMEETAAAIFDEAADITGNDDSE